MPYRHCILFTWGTLRSQSYFVCSLTLENGLLSLSYNKYMTFTGVDTLFLLMNFMYMRMNDNCYGKKEYASFY